MTALVINKGKPAQATWRYFYEARKAAGLTQVQLAKRCRLWQNQIGKWERGEHAPLPEHYTVLADALGIQVNDFAVEVANFFSAR